MELQGRVAWITGGARIGSVVATELARRGVGIVLSYRHSKQAAERTAAAIRAHGASVLVVRADVAKENDVRKVVQRIDQTFGRLDILVNMASIYELRAFKRLRLSDWRLDVDANATSAFLTVSASARFLIKARGRIINIADWTAASGRPRYKGFSTYHAAKSAVLGLTQSQALELAPHVLVNAIAPGPILPPQRISNEEVRNVADVTPLGKWGGALEIAKTVLFLCETDFVTGECIRVDGGRHLY